MKVPSVSGAFSKLKSIFEKIIPFIGIIVGFFVGPWVIQPVAGWIADKLKVAGISDPDSRSIRGNLIQYAHFLPAGLIVGIPIGLGGTIIKSFGDIFNLVGNFAIGFAVGLFLFCLYAPLSDDIGFGWW